MSMTLFLVVQSRCSHLAARSSPLLPPKPVNLDLGISLMKRRMFWSFNLICSRPTAVNLSDAATKLKQIAAKVAETCSEAKSLFEAYIEASEIMLKDDVASNKAIGSHGGSFIQRHLENSMRISMLTHCNTSSLATAGYGTALGVTRSLYTEGVLERAYCIETRPFNQVVSMMMVGHLGEVALSSSSLAISLSGVTGFSLLLGMASALEMLCGQAYGTEQYKKIGLHIYTAIFSLNLVCLPLAMIWIFMADILIFIGQDPV